MTEFDPKLTIVIKVLQALPQAEQDTIVKALAKAPLIIDGSKFSKEDVDDWIATQFTAPLALFDDWNYDMSAALLAGKDKLLFVSYLDTEDRKPCVGLFEGMGFACIEALDAYAWKLAPEPAKVK